MVDWKVSVTTTYCDFVDADVPIMVFSDWSTKCVGYKKYSPSKAENTANIQKEKRKKVTCDGPECSRMIEYRDKLFAEEQKERRQKEKGV